MKECIAFREQMHYGAGMEVIERIHAIEAALKDARIPMREFFLLAGLNPSTWTRWRSGSNGPRLNSWQAAHKAAEQLIQKAKAAA